jgi:hypothetical protein
MGIKILKCSCNNEFQDKEYGKGMRVFNSGGNINSTVKTYRCTVCESEIRR